PAGITKLIQFQNAFQFQDDLTMTRGAHTLKFGAMMERFQWNSDQPAFIQGNINFNSVQNFLLAGPVGTSATLLLPQSSTYRALRTRLFAFYAQDDYKVKPNLTLNYGLRWEFTTGLNEKFNHISHFAPPKGPLDATQSDLATGSLYKNRIPIFEPRFGFNWGIAGS